MQHMKNWASVRVRLSAGAAALLVLGVATTPMAMAQTPRPISVTPPAGAPMSFADLIERVSPAVVSVQVTTQVSRRDLESRLSPFRGLPGFEEYEDRFGEGEGEDGPETDQEGNALGSGFFITPQGHVVTNHHVVENAREVTITLKNGDELEAEIVGTDAQTDMALLKVKKAGTYPYVQFAERVKPRVGDWVVAVGNPFGLGGTATAGIVSADGRELSGGAYNDFIQVDAAINKGNSGGPTFNLNGEVVGVNTAIYSNIGGGSVGIGFAIEAGAAKRIADTLMRDGKVVRGWLGVEIQNLDPRFAEAYGVKDTKGAIVNRVTKGGPAEDGGIRPQDIIIAVNGDKIESNRQLTQRVGSLIAGSRNSFRVIREGKEQTIWVTVRERDPNLGRAIPATARTERPPTPEAQPTDVEVLGGTVRPLTAAEQGRFELTEPGTGLLVVTLKRTSALGDAAISVGDALLAANGKALKSAKDLEDAVAAAKAEGKENIALLVGCSNTAQCTTLLHPVKIN